MPATKHHMKLSIRGCLMNWGPRSHGGLNDDQGKPLSNAAAKAELLDLLSKGVEYLPIGDCDAWDPKTGCPGHAVEETHAVGVQPK
jgi:hypothetical protein